MSFLLLGIHIAASILLIIIVLLQQGKGADLGATFGGGGNTLFGASGADNILTKATTIIALVFMLTSVLLASKLQPRSGVGGSIIGDLPERAAAPSPVAPINPVADPSSPPAPVTETMIPVEPAAPAVNTDPKAAPETK